MQLVHAGSSPLTPGRSSCLSWLVLNRIEWPIVYCVVRLRFGNVTGAPTPRAGSQRVLPALSMRPQTLSLQSGVLRRISAIPFSTRWDSSRLVSLLNAEIDFVDIDVTCFRKRPTEVLVAASVTLADVPALRLSWPRSAGPHFCRHFFAELFPCAIGVLFRFELKGLTGDLVRSSLSRLCRDGAIRRLTRGVHDYYQTSRGRTTEGIRENERNVFRQGA